MTQPNTLIPFSDEWEQYMRTRPIEEVVALFKQCGNENLRLIGRTIKDKEVEKSEWQLCPKCNGEGEIHVNELLKNPYGTSAIIGLKTCDVCGGAKLIARHSKHSDPDPAQLISIEEEIIDLFDYETLYTKRDIIEMVKSRLQQMANEFKGEKG